MLIRALQYDGPRMGYLVFLHAWNEEHLLFAILGLVSCSVFTYLDVYSSFGWGSAFIIKVGWCLLGSLAVQQLLFSSQLINDVLL